jgi:hypothetical protein
MDSYKTKTLKVDQLLLLALSIVIVGLWIPRWAGPVDLRWDGAVYYILGSSIAEGKGYRLLHEPGEIEAGQYPPLLPLLAAAPFLSRMSSWIKGTRDPVTPICCPSSRAIPARGTWCTRMRKDRFASMSEYEPGRGQGEAMSR